MSGIDEIDDVLSAIHELGFVKIAGGKIEKQVLPRNNLYTEERWDITVRYLGVYAREHPSFGGEYFLCVYDGWREYSEYVPHEARKYVPWSKETAVSFTGVGVGNEPRFVHQHDDISLYPVLPRKVIAYNRHLNDTSVLLIPDAQFLQTEFQLYKAKVNVGDVPWGSKRDVVVWRGSQHVGKGCGYMDHGFGKMHPRILATNYLKTGLPTSKEVASYYDVSFEQRDIAWMLQHKYLLDIDGMVSAWSGLYWKLYSGSVVIKLQSHWEQWYYRELTPYVHYVPLASIHEVPTIMQWCHHNQDACKRIARTATEFVKGITCNYACTGYIIH